MGRISPALTIFKNLEEEFLEKDRIFATLHNI